MTPWHLSKHRTRNNRYSKAYVSTTRVWCNKTLNLQMSFKVQTNRQLNSRNTQRTAPTHRDVTFWHDFLPTLKSLQWSARQRTRKSCDTLIWSPLHTLAHAHTLHKHMHRMTVLHSLRQLEKGFCGLSCSRYTPAHMDLSSSSHRLSSSPHYLFVHTRTQG